MVRKQKVSHRKNSRPVDLPLNGEEVLAEGSKERIEPAVEEMEAEKPEALDQIDDQIPEIHPDRIHPLPTEEGDDEDMGVGTGLPIPQNPLRFQEPVVKPTVTHVAPRPTGNSHPKTEPESNILRYTIMVGGALFGVIILYLLFFSGGKKKSPSPTIVEVTDAKEERKSERDGTSNSKMSSPRIIFGDLRRNPSLAVAPPVQQ